jgi:hypothetical protein
VESAHGFENMRVKDAQELKNLSEEKRRLQSEVDEMRIENEYLKQ